MTSPRCSRNCRHRSNPSRIGTAPKTISANCAATPNGCAPAASSWRSSVSSRAANRSCSTHCSARSRSKSGPARRASRVCSRPTSTPRPQRSPSFPTRKKKPPRPTIRADAPNECRWPASRVSLRSAAWAARGNCTTRPTTRATRPHSYASASRRRFWPTVSSLPIRPVSRRSIPPIGGRRCRTCPAPMPSST